MYFKSKVLFVLYVLPAVLPVVLFSAFVIYPVGCVCGYLAWAWKQCREDFAAGYEQGRAESQYVDPAERHRGGLL